MSIAIVQQERYDCAFPDCDDTRTETSSVQGSYCSQECADRHTGRKFVRLVREDHRFCWSCLRIRKEIEQPTAFARRGLGPITDEALQGFEYHSEHVTMGEYGLECTCGAVDHDIDGYFKREDGPYHWHILLLVEQITSEGQTNYDFDLATFADVFWETDDFELSLGRALSD